MSSTLGNYWKLGRWWNGGAGPLGAKNRQLQKNRPLPHLAVANPLTAPPPTIAPTGTGDIYLAELTEEPPILAELVADQPVITAELVGNTAATRVTFWRMLGWFWMTIGNAAEWVFGLFSLVFILSVVAVIPVLQLLTLGYLLESSARVARSGRLRDGFIGIRQGAKLGGILIALGIAWLPLRLISQMQYEAQLIDPANPSTRNLTIILVLLLIALSVHFYGAFLRGGRLRDFLLPARPIKLWRRITRPNAWNDSLDAVWNFVIGLRLPYFFWLGARGFAGTLIWLAIPVTMILIGRNAPLVGWLGGISTAVVLTWLPFLQTHFAVENRWRAMFEWRRVRRLYCHAPVAWTFGLFLLLALTPLFFAMQAELLDTEIIWFFSMIMIFAMWPGRFMIGWGMGRALRHPDYRWFGFRYAGRLAMFAIAAAYTGFQYLTQFTTWYGGLNLYLQPAFLIPAPFLGGS
ncbi:MAG: hypothetical protein SFX18_19040 [Pirellulales bacterium]|nr:hypothetical protein [Pirellulales bacterium]